MIGAIRPGQKVFGADGRQCRVIAVTDTFIDPDCYRLTFDDGSTFVVSSDHLWLVERRTRRRIPMAYNKPGPKRLYRENVLLSAREIAAHDHATDNRLAIRCPPPLDLPARDLPIAPYLLGCWLGDGTSRTGRIACGDDIWTEIAKTDSFGGDKTPALNAQLRNIDGLSARLRRLGLLSNKHIPAVYLRASVEQRLSLLQGLMDTDGHCDTRGTATFVNINVRLVDDFCELANSLGLKPHRRLVEMTWRGEPYEYFQVSFQAYQDLPPFRLQRKLARCRQGSRKNPRRYIVSCEPEPSVPMRCIQVDSPDGLYLTGRSMTVTHNSTIITFCGVIQEVLRDQEITIGIFAHDRTAAKAFLRQIKDEFEQNTLLRTLFPDILWSDPLKQSPKWSLDEGIMVRRKSNPKEATVEAWGLVDGMPTGKHFGLMVYDDVVTEQSVTTPEMIKKVTERWELSDNLGSIGHRTQMIGTRYSFGDTYGLILERGSVKARIFPATDDGTFNGKPVFLTEDEWQRKISRQSKSIIAAQLLLNPLVGSDTAFDVLDLQRWEVRPRTLNIYILCDPSRGRNDSADNTAFVVIGVDANLNKFVLDGWAHRMSLSARWQILFNTWRRWNKMPGVTSVAVGYEQFGMQTDIEYFEEQMRRENIVFPIEELKWPREGRRSKDWRIERLEPDIRTGKFMLPASFQYDPQTRQRKDLDPLKSKAAQEMIARGQGWRCATRLFKKDEDGRLYDFSHKFLEEFIFFPVTPRNDILDVCSRIYDMNIVPPVTYDEGGKIQTSVEPPVFVDGV